MNQSKYIYLLAGPSGSGKSSVARKITEWYGFKEVWSYTERPPRYAGEPGHIFVTPEEFDAAGPMCAFTLYNGYRYGVPQSEIDSSLLYVIDPAGIEYMKNHYAGSKGIAVIGIWVPEEVRRERMISRGDAPAMVPEHIMSAKDCAYIFDVCAAGRVEDAREMLGRFVTAHVAK